MELDVASFCAERLSTFFSGIVEITATRTQLNIYVDAATASSGDVSVEPR